MIACSDKILLLGLCRVAALHGRIDALYLNAGRQFFGASYKDVCHCSLARLCVVKNLPSWPASAVDRRFCDAHAGDSANSDMRQMQLVFDTNFWGPVRVFQAALPLMPKTGESLCHSWSLLGPLQSDWGTPGSIRQWLEPGASLVCRPPLTVLFSFQYQL